MLALFAIVACAPPDDAEPAADGVVLAQAAGGARTGSWAARATLASGPTWKKLIAYDTKVTPRTRYSASVWARGTGRLRLDVVNGAWNSNVASVSIDATSTWQRYAVDFDSGSETVVHYNFYDAVGGKNGDVFLDDAFLGPAGGANLLSNPSFESGNASWIVEAPFRTERLGGGSAPSNPPVSNPPVGNPPSSNPATTGGGAARTGKWAASIDLATGPSWKKLIHYDSKVSKNTRHAAYIWARGRGKVRLDVVNAPWNANLASVIIDATSTWTRFAVPEFDTGDNDVVHYNVYDAVGGVAGTVSFDDAFLGRPGGANLLANAGFEEGTHSWISEGKFRIDSTTPAPPSPIAPTDTPDITPDPDGVYFAEVTANGTGCPAGTWNTRISRDGLVFTMSFSAYEVRLDRTTTLSVKDCQLAIRLHTPADRSFSVQAFSYSGYAFLQPGVTGRQLATYSFQGQGVQANAARTDLTGPHDADFVFRDDVEIQDAVWSPCGVERELNVSTRLLLQSSAPGPSAYMNLTAADGAARLVLKLAAKTCK
ncbi:MAG: DUF4360 domain-containing protein [Polyangiales bacterium]